MPEVRDIEVHVTSSEGVELPEWGIHTFRRSHKTSAYIQSKTDMLFRVSIKPKIPYVAADVASAHVYETRRRGSDRPGCFQMEDEWEDVDGGENMSTGDGCDLYDQLRFSSRSASHHKPEDSSEGRRSSKRHASRLHRRSSSDRDSRDRRIRREPSEANISLSSPPPSRDFRRTPPPPFHFLASLYLDGRRKAERKLVVYLDPDDEDFNQPDGKVHFRTRWVQGNDGKLREHGWVFKDVGIETVFDKMLLSGDHHVSGKVHMREEDSIIAAMNATDLGAEGDVEREERTKLGQIVVTIERIKLGKKWVDGRYRAHHKEGDVDDVEMDGANTEITHTAGFGQARALKSEAVRVVAYSPYLEGEGVYATFQFFYRSEDMLRKFNFPGYLPSQLIHRNRRYLNAKISTLTPLGISNPLGRKTQSNNDKATTFEEAIKKGRSPAKLSAEYRFGDGYRDDDNVKIENELWGCGLEIYPLWSSRPSSSRRRSRSPPKISTKMKENQRPERPYKSSDAGQCDLHSIPLENKILTSPSLKSKRASSIISPGSDIALPPNYQDLKSPSQGPEISLLGGRAASTISLPSTGSPPTPKPAADGKTSLELYRKAQCESDADDEASDKETHHGSDEEAVADDNDDQVRFEEAEDDRELQSAMHRIQLGKRSRDGADDDDGRADFDRGELGLRSHPPAAQSTMEMSDPREAERDRAIARESDAQSRAIKRAESAGPAKRRKGSEGHLVGTVGQSPVAQTGERETVGGEMGNGTAEV